MNDNKMDKRVHTHLKPFVTVANSDYFFSLKALTFWREKFGDKKKVFEHFNA